MSATSSISRLALISSHLQKSKASLCTSTASSTAISEHVFARGSQCPPVTPGKLRLYSMRFCPWAQRTRLVLLHKNIPHETVNVHLAKKPAWLFERNPLGLVPILELDKQIVFESSATCYWLDEVYPENRLTPTDPYTRAWDRILEDNFGKIAMALYAVIGTEDKDKTLKNLHKSYKFYEGVLAERGGPFYGGAHPAMIDYLMWPHMERIPAIFRKLEPAALVNKESYPYLDAWYTCMYQLPAVKATLFDDESHMKFIMALANKTFDMYDYGL